MHFLMTFRMDTEAANEAARKGTLASTIQSILADLKPEAAYFGDQDGDRTAFLVVNLEDASQLPAVAEPWFLAFQAKARAHLVMTPEDLANAAEGIADAVQKYG